MDCKGTNWTGILLYEKELFSDENNICAPLFCTPLLKKCNFSCCQCMLESVKRAFLLLQPPSRKTRFKLTFKNCPICSLIGPFCHTIQPEMLHNFLNCSTPCQKPCSYNVAKHHAITSMPVQKKKLKIKISNNQQNNSTVNTRKQVCTPVHKS